MKKPFFVLITLLFVDCILWSQNHPDSLKNQVVDFGGYFTLTLPPGYYAKQEPALHAKSWDIKGGDLPLIVYLTSNPTINPNILVNMPTDTNRYEITHFVFMGGKWAELAVVKPGKFGANTGVQFMNVCDNQILSISTWSCDPTYTSQAINIIKTIKFKK
jgi:hypothetical protein